MDDDVINLLRLADAAHHVPHFVRHKVTANNVIYLNDQQLQSIGVFEIGLRHNILRYMLFIIAFMRSSEKMIPECGEDRHCYEDPKTLALLYEIEDESLRCLFWCVIIVF